MTAVTEVDALIVGGGPVGLAAGCALRAAGMKVLVADAGPAGRALDDARVIALSAGSHDILRGLGTWPASDVTPIHHIHISQRGHFGRTELHAPDYGVDALGHVARAGTLARALGQRATALGLEVRYDTPVAGAQERSGRRHIQTASGEIAARVLLWCEGRIAGDEPLSRSRDYGQQAIIALATPVRPHGNVAYERFTPGGPVALLPYGRDYAVVYTCADADAAALLAEPEARFAARLSAVMGERVQFSAIRQRNAWPLVLRMRSEIVRGREVWLGNAAQTLHPVAGQGLNLALRDVAQLAAILLPALARDEGDIDTALQRYAQLRRTDRAATGGFTDALVRVFGIGAGNPALDAVAGHARGAALALLDACPPARRFLGRRMMFGARGWP